MHPKKPRVPRLDILAAPDRFFDDDHYRGYPAVLVRLVAIPEAELAGRLRNAWRVVAPKAMLERYEP